MKNLGLTNRISSLRNKLVRNVKTSSRGKTRKSVKKYAPITSGLKLPDFMRNNAILIKVGISLLVIVFSIVIIDLFIFYNGIKLEKYNDTDLINTAWNGSDRVNILFIGIDEKSSGHKFVDRVVVVHVNPDAPSAGIFSVNTRFQTSMPDGTKSTLRLAFMNGLEQDKPVEFVVTGFENLVGVKVHKYVLLTADKMKTIFENIPNPNVEIEEKIEDIDFEPIESGNRNLSPDDLYNYLATDSNGSEQQMESIVNYLKSLSRNIIQVKNVLQLKPIVQNVVDNVYTDISKQDIIQFFIFFSNLRDDQITVAYTKDASGLPDAEDPFKLTPVLENIDEDFKAILINPKVRFEQARIEVLNATELSGVASRKARLIENLGGRVIRVGNTPDDYNRNYIFVKNPEDYEITLEEINSVFEGNVTLLREEYPNRHVGDIVIVIGVDDNI